MKPDHFVRALSALNCENTFNPYSNRCAIHDLDDAPLLRSQALLSMLKVATRQDIDSIWIGRDLGYRGGRRTGLALTDDAHISAHAKRWGITVERPTKGDLISERTAAILWKIFSQIDVSVFLWNVFPLHPHKVNNPFSNRAHNSYERKIGEEFLFNLISMLRPKRLIAIGNDAAQSAKRLGGRRKVVQVRHPSYGGQTQFLSEIRELYDLCLDNAHDAGGERKI